MLISTIFPAVIEGLLWSICVVFLMVVLVIGMRILATLLKEFTEDED